MGRLQGLRREGRLDSDEKKMWPDTADGTGHDGIAYVIGGMRQTGRPGAERDTDFSFAE